jgi:hypothetical protein
MSVPFFIGGKYYTKFFFKMEANTSTYVVVNKVVKNAFMTWHEIYNMNSNRKLES